MALMSGLTGPDRVCVPAWTGTGRVSWTSWGHLRGIYLRIVVRPSMRIDGLRLAVWMRG